MTIVVYDGKTLAADSLTVRGDTIYNTNTIKIHKLKDGRYLAGAGASSEILDVVNWYNSHKKQSKPKLDNFQAIITSLDGKAIEIYTDLVEQDRPIPSVMGSGMDYALSALKLGHDAIQAVKVACDLNVYCGGDIYYIDDPNGEILCLKN